MASVQGPQVVLESSGVSGCPITRKLETFSILSVKNKNGAQKLMMLLGTPPLCKIFVPESFDKPRKRNHRNKQKPQSVALMVDMLTHQLSHEPHLGSTVEFYCVSIFIKMAS